VVPELAAREHIRNLPVVLEGAFTQAGISRKDVGAVAATFGPGLVGSLQVGLSVARGLAWQLRVPFFAVHHIAGHLVSPFLKRNQEAAEAIPESFVGLVLSGGHSCLFGVEGSRVSTLAETRDDAFGEAFDKVGKRVGFPYPQGPYVDRWAELGDARRAPLPFSGRSRELYFSYSGLKTEVAQALERLKQAGVPTQAVMEQDPPLAPEVLDLLAGFRASAVRQVLLRLNQLHRRRPFGLLAVSGGAAANRLLRRELVTWAEAKQVELRLVELVYAGDNAAMIGFAALRRWLQGDPGEDPTAVEAVSRVPLSALA
jgi:N6-L-threonylcarbamoyladenine synthase